jgi:hypothetical protein
MSLPPGAPGPAPINLQVTNLSLSPRFNVIWQEWHQAAKDLRRLECVIPRSIPEIRAETAAAGASSLQVQILSDQVKSRVPGIMRTILRTSRPRIINRRVREWLAGETFKIGFETGQLNAPPAMRIHGSPKVSHGQPVMPLPVYPEDLFVERVFSVKVAPELRRPSAQKTDPRGQVLRTRGSKVSRRLSRMSRRLLTYAAARAQTNAKEVIRAQAISNDVSGVQAVFNKTVPAHAIFKDTTGVRTISDRVSSSLCVLSYAPHRLPGTPPVTPSEITSSGWRFREKRPLTPSIPPVETGTPRMLSPQMPPIKVHTRINPMAQGRIRYAAAPVQVFFDRLDSRYWRVLSITESRRRRQLHGIESGERSVSRRGQEMPGTMQFTPRTFASPHALSNVLPAPSIARSSSVQASQPVERVFRTETPAAPTQSAAITPAPPAPVPKAPQIDIAKLDTVLWQRFEKRLRIEQERRGRF